MENQQTRVLIVDDNEAIHDDFKEILNPEILIREEQDQILRAELFGEELEGEKPKINTIHYKIDDAFQGMEAIEMIEKADIEGNPYALVFMDVRMPPGINGVETIQRIWKDHAEIEMVLCTAYSDYTWEKILDEFGTTDHLLFIKKPFDSVSIKQIALSLTTKWQLSKSNQQYVENLETEVSKRTEKLNELVERLSEEISLRKKNEEQLSSLANFDTLTGLGNRFFFNKAIKEIIESDKNDQSQAFALFFIDIDYFKQVNDLMGHDVGDLLLIEISKRLNDCLRLSSLELSYSVAADEEKSTKGVFRLGGDEFTAFIGFESMEQVMKAANKTVETIKKPYHIANKEITISCSIGISIFPRDAQNQPDLIKYADVAMYRAKETKGTCVLFDKDVDSSYLAQLVLEEELTKALLNEQIILNYQALMDKAQGLIGIQALARWDHPRRGVLQPGEFISIAEKSHHIIEIGKYILYTACRHLKELHRQGFNNLFVFVNCTNKQFYNPGFIDQVQSALEEAELEPSFLKLGLEEKFSIQNPDKSLSIIKKLKDMGIKFAIEGFGKEDSILNFLQKVPEDSYIKIDRHYVERLEEDPNNVKFLYSMLDLIKNRNLNAIVSGIETEKQKQIITKKECIYQGFYFNKPKAFDDFLSDMKQLKASLESN